jgi:phosphoribosylanthranilate isomerase
MAPQEDKLVVNTRIKVCGLTTPDDAVMVADAGVDAIGMVFYAPSPRAVSVDLGAAIARAVGPFMTTVALLVNPDIELVEQVISRVRPSLLQFHGDESEDFCAQFNYPYLKALRMKPGMDVRHEAALFSSASGILCDTWNPDLYGGTGESFDWTRLQGVAGFPLILAGGLTPDNVGRGLSLAQPYAVDVSGGVESAKGIKDRDKVTAFVRAVRAFDAQTL